jgi:hypothetical protein
MNLVDRRAHAAQNALLAITRERPENNLRELPRLIMPAHHEVRAENVDLKRLGAVLAAAYDRQFRDFASLLLMENLGPRTLQALALIAEVIHGTPTRFSDPARFSFAHGGKDGHPFPVPLKVYDRSLQVLRSALNGAKVGHSDKLEAFRRLDGFVRTIERTHEPRADFAGAVAHERAISKSIGGRTVLDDRRTRPARKGTQLSLFGD